MSDYILAHEAAKILGCDISALRRAVKRGYFPGSRKAIFGEGRVGKAGKRWLIPEEAVLAFQKEYPRWPNVTTGGQGIKQKPMARRCIVDKGECPDPNDTCVGCERLVQGPATFSCSPLATFHEQGGTQHVRSKRNSG
jgi:hypothetical protein